MNTDNEWLILIKNWKQGNLVENRLFVRALKDEDIHNHLLYRKPLIQGQAFFKKTIDEIMYKITKKK